jgi:hypothetical protein
MSPETVALITSAVHWVGGTLLAAAVLFFVVQFLAPGIRVGTQLKRARAKLSALRSKGPVLDLDLIRGEALSGEALLHCWDEFRDTLHGQKQASAKGALEVARWRATATANAFFTEQALVDSPLRTEFYKHLPGMLTGIGIIGTFSGLILGLQAFGQVDLGDAAQARLGLRAWLGAVGGAFVVSGAAIALAMLLTAVEKVVINRLYTRLESLCGVIDSLFDSGAGEEYLQRLVDAAETSATQAIQMKESLVTDLKQVLTELTQQQISTMTATSAQLGQSITTSLNDGLKEPLARISDAVQAVSSGQGDAVSKLLTNVLSSFTAKMENMFGGQMRGMGEMLTQTASTIQLASQRFEQLVAEIQQAGSGTTDAMARSMTEAIAQMQARQTEANDQMRGFIEQMKQNIAQGQAENSEQTLAMMQELSETTGALVKSLQEQARATQRDNSKVQIDTAQQMCDVVQQLVDSAKHGQNEAANATTKLLGEMGEATASMVRNLQDQAHSAQAQHSERQSTLAVQTAELLAKQSDQLSRLADTVQRTETSMRDTVERIKAATDTHLERMGVGAERMQGASDRLSENLGLMKANSDGLSGSADRLNAASSVLSTALTATQHTLDDQKSVRDALAAMVTDLRTTIETAKREAVVSSGLVDGLQQASQRLVDAQVASVTNLEDATEAIGDAHGAFAKQVEITLREGNRVFHEELASATGLLKGAIQDLGDVLDNLPTPA